MIKRRRNVLPGAVVVVRVPTGHKLVVGLVLRRRGYFVDIMYASTVPSGSPGQEQLVSVNQQVYWVRTDIVHVVPVAWLTTHLDDVLVSLHVVLQRFVHQHGFIMQ